MVRIRAEKVLIGDELIPAAITVKDGLVSAIERDGAAAEGDVVVRSGKVLIPGLIEYAHLLTLRPAPMVPAIHS
jgi:alpha-D-ribose 1-methylphosphonate 5-triphosphate diphosphatase PhnM